MVDAAVDRQASDVLLLDVQPVCSFADYFVILTCMNPRHMNAVAEAMEKVADAAKLPALHREGTPESGWVLLDFGDIIGHLFTAPVRERYALEQLWQAAPTVVRMQ